MLIAGQELIEALESPMQQMQARVELHRSSALLNTFTDETALSGLTIERLGEKGKFFGYGICQKLNIELVDLERQITIEKGDAMKVELGTDSTFVAPYPSFYVDDVKRDESMNTLTVAAYDKLYGANTYTVADLLLPNVYTLNEFLNSCAALLGLTIKITVTDDVFDTIYNVEDESLRPNFDGTESLRQALNFVAEATQTIYFINSQDELVFVRLDMNGEPALYIPQDKHYDLFSEGERILASICSATELGDNTEATVSVDGLEGDTQYVRDNPFWELRGDLTELLEAAIAKVGGLTLTQFSCDWAGNFLLEIGDKIALQAEDGSYFSTYVLVDTITYNGTLSEFTEWSYEASNSETPSNPSNLGEVLKQTFAKVDKVNHTITLLTSQTEANANAITSLELTTDSINASVLAVDTRLVDVADTMNQQLVTLRNQVEATMTEDEFNIKITEAMENGIERVETATGYTFDDEGLRISKSNSEMETQITEDGMTVYRESEAMLVANNAGVEAANLHAKTYLIIGNNSRIEDYGDNRTGCFWIGG